jgi:hypothetical protein
MTGDIDLHGVLVASLLVWLALAYLISLPLRAGLARIGFYRLVWHRALFDAALIIVITGAIVAVSHLERLS